MRLSIVTPNRNGARWLEQTLDSVIDQEGDFHLEYIVADAASNDGSQAIIHARESRIARWWSASDLGQYDAINQAFAQCSGHVMAWINSDDFYLPGTLAIVNQIFESLPEVEWLTTNRPGYVHDHGDIAFRSVPGYAKEAFRQGRYVPQADGWSYGAIQQESTFWRRSLWERAGGELDLSYRLAADFVLWRRFFEEASLYAVDVPLAVYRYREGQRSSDVDSYMLEVRRCLGATGVSIGEQLLLRPAYRTIPGARSVATALGYLGHRVTQTGGRWSASEYRFF